MLASGRSGDAINAIQSRLPLIAHVPESAYGFGEKGHNRPARAAFADVGLATDRIQVCLTIGDNHPRSRRPNHSEERNDSRPHALRNQEDKPLKPQARISGERTMRPVPQRAVLLFGLSGLCLTAAFALELGRLTGWSGAAPAVDASDVTVGDASDVTGSI